MSLSSGSGQRTERINRYLLRPIPKPPNDDSGSLSSRPHESTRKRRDEPPREKGLPLLHFCGGLIRRPALAEALANGLIAICPLGGRLKPLFDIGDQVSLLRRSRHHLNSASRSWPSPCCSWPTLGLGILRGITEPSTTPMPRQTAHTAAAVKPIRDTTFTARLFPRLPSASASGTQIVCL